MVHRAFVLLNMQTDGEPLMVEYRENVPIQNEDQVLCELSWKQVSDIINNSYGSYLEDNLYIPQDIIREIERKEKK